MTIDTPQPAGHGALTNSREDRVILKEASTSILTIETLAQRWGLPVPVLRRRLLQLCLPAVNVGTKKSPDYRFRLSAIQAWEQANESTLGASEPVGFPAPAGAPPGLEG